jgi:hypothetical protein
MGGRHGRVLPASGRSESAPERTPAARRTGPATSARRTGPPDLGEAMARLLRTHGFDPRRVRVQVASTDDVPGPTRGGAAASLEAGGPCPDGQVRRVVCEFRNGRFMCEERCVPA